ncbi:TIR domain-containing protein [Rhizobium leguminosarum]|uniref:toll/interleukin-1 receptor domain-containing protein n=1 Tax=Rhizobium ruizarguesonis TaxID=2081791 RepID=UPI0013B9928C|nr:toll/interleukin-1 receptor domain-containing protein [Rhizobium ruizarguesonis]NEI03676.1 TIR domain-containing protein [Rhizobium ruizarguesonis]
MAKCTAPVRGHTGGGAASCPACSSRSRYRGYSRYDSGSYSSPSYSTTSSSSGLSSGRSSGGGSGRRTSRPRWSGGGSSAWYTPEQVQALTPVRENVESLAASQPDLRDVFLCHAWDDRQGSAKELHDLLEARGVRVWFSEKDLGLGVPMMRAIDKGLVNSRVGIVLVTPAMLRRLPAEGIADKELSALLRRERLVPVVHGTTYDELEQVSLLLASRAGLNTGEESMEEVAKKIAELVAA